MLTINSDSPGAAARLNPTDQHGVTCPLYGVPSWSSSDESVATLEVAEDGLSAVLKPVAKGTCKVTVTGLEGDPEAGVDHLPDAVADVNVVDPEATQVSITFGPPQ